MSRKILSLVEHALILNRKVRYDRAKFAKVKGHKALKVNVILSGRD